MISQKTRTQLFSIYILLGGILSSGIIISPISEAAPNYSGRDIYSEVDYCLSDLTLCKDHSQDDILGVEKANFELRILINETKIKLNGLIITKNSIRNKENRNHVIFEMSMKLYDFIKRTEPIDFFNLKEREAIKQIDEIATNFVKNLE